MSTRARIAQIARKEIVKNEEGQRYSLDKSRFPAGHVLPPYCRLHSRTNWSTSQPMLPTMASVRPVRINSNLDRSRSFASASAIGSVFRTMYQLMPRKTYSSAKEWSQAAKVREKDAEQLRETRFVKDVQFETEFNIYGDKVAMLSFRRPYAGVIIEDRAIVQTLLSMWKIVWNQTK